MERIDVVLKEFFHLAPIPRPSHHGERVSEYLYQWAKDHTHSSRYAIHSSG